MKTIGYKRIIACLLAALLLLSFAACGDNQKKEDANGKTTDTTTAEQTVETTAPSETTATTFVETIPTTAPTESTPEEPVAKPVENGDIITFGTYEQDNDLTNGAEPIEWIVLDKQDGKVLVVSKYGLDCKLYNEKNLRMTWEECTLRSWLNNEFLNEAFDATEQNRVLTTTVVNSDNSHTNMDGGNDTQDQVFLLSFTEAKSYLASDMEVMCQPTPYAISNGAYASDGAGNCWWWLRSPGNHQNDAALCSPYGSKRYEGVNVNYVDVAVRPAMWIELS